MSAVELNHQPNVVEQTTTEFTKLELNHHNSITQQGQQNDLISTSTSKSAQHPLHTYDLTKMAKFYESCVSKLSEQQPTYKPTEWVKATPIPGHLNAEEQRRWSNPLVLSEKQRVLECFTRLARDLGEPMILMPSFELSDLQNFEMFLDALKLDGVNAIRKYKQYLNGKDMRKDELDLVCVHARYGMILVECRDSDYIDYRRKSRAKFPITQAKNLFKSLGKLIAESKGLQTTEAQVPIMEFVALPNVRERPQQQQTATPKTEGQTQPATTKNRGLSYLVKADLENSTEFAKWWSKNVVEPKLEQERLATEQNKVNKFDWQLLNSLVSLISCIKSNSILPVVYPETETTTNTTTTTQSTTPTTEEKKDTTNESLQFQPALNIHAEFFRPKHEESRALSKCVLLSRDSDRIRKTICLQTLWLMLNDSQKKISVVCSDLNKPYYEEFFARQRKIYTNLNNLRFYTDLHSCDATGTHTLKKDGECWIFDASIQNGSLSDIIERAKQLKSYWIFSDKYDQCEQLRSQLEEMSAKLVKLDEDLKPEHQHQGVSSLLSETSIKLPLRLQCDLLVIGDMVGQNQLKFLYKFLQTKSVISQASMYNQQQQHHHHNHRHQQPQQQNLNFIPAEKFRSVKFIRGGTIDNIRNSLKMHDSIQAQCVIVHVGDEDVFKTRNSVSTIERVKELTTLVKEYCPKSFTVLSTLMRRRSKTENTVTNEVNKGIVQFCQQTKESLNCFYMLNNHFEPEYHTQGGRLLNNKGLKLYVDNVLFVIDYFYVKNNKQH